MEHGSSVVERRNLIRESPDSNPPSCTPDTGGCSPQFMVLMRDIIPTRYIRTFHGEGIRTLKSGFALIKNIIALFEDEGPGLQITMLYISSCWMV